MIPNLAIYQQAVPRYTSYPPMPDWEKKPPNQAAWRASVQQSFKAYNKVSGLALYIHLPYCEQLCTFCGCTKRITKNHAVETPYIEALLTEWKWYAALFNEKPVLKELHLGGGTPTFFSPENLHALLTNLLTYFDGVEKAHLSFEAHPGVTSYEHLRVLSSIGFCRVSFGIQDFNAAVQTAINRFQSKETVAKVTEWSRSLGFTSVNYDLVYGLPFQTKEAIKHTIAAVLEQKPDRIAFYGYAHVPWHSKGQRRYTDENIPNGTEKLALYALGKELLIAGGYQEIGMDHFALANDELFMAQQNGKLNRNFMGYTTTEAKVLIGLGASAISETPDAYHQNLKDVEQYLTYIKNSGFAPLKGHLLSSTEKLIKNHIKNLMCNFETNWPLFDSEANALWYKAKEKLMLHVANGFLTMQPGHIQVTPKGRQFVRTICAALDPAFLNKEHRYSKGV